MNVTSSVCSFTNDTCCPTACGSSVSCASLFQRPPSPRQPRHHPPHPTPCAPGLLPAGVRQQAPLPAQVAPEPGAAAVPLPAQGDSRLPAGAALHCACLLPRLATCSSPGASSELETSLPAGLLRNSLPLLARRARRGRRQLRPLQAALGPGHLLERPVAALPVAQRPVQLLRPRGAQQVGGGGSGGGAWRRACSPACPVWAGCPAQVRPFHACLGRCPAHSCGRAAPRAGACSTAR